MAQDQQPTFGELAVPKSMDFYDDFVPGLAAGKYRFVVQQTASVTDTVYYRDQPFEVTGPRFSLPAEDVHATFPPDGGRGGYANRLPHMVLRKRALPWERKIGAGAPNTSGPNPEPLPWLALLVLSDADLDAARAHFEAADGKAGPPVQVTSVIKLNELFPTTADGAGTGRRRGLGLHGKASLLPDIPQELSDGDGSATVRVLDLPYSIFARVCPRLADLPCLAHRRKVPTDNKAPLAMHADGDFAVLLANRFPQPGSNTVYLISLEGWGVILAGLDQEDPSLPDRIRLVVLESWTFNDDVHGSHTFAELMKNLSPGLLAAPLGEAGSRNVRADSYLNYGYVPVAYQPRTGDVTLAWYRGPFAPHLTESQGAGHVFANADAALVLDTGTGLVDISYSAAWQLGRLLALSSTPFADNLRLFLDSHNEARRAFAAAKDLAADLISQEIQFESLWTDELSADLVALRAGRQLDAESRRELIDALITSQVTEEKAAAAVDAIAGVGADDTALRAALSGLGLAANEIDELVVVSWAGQAAVLQGITAGGGLIHWLGALALLYPIPFEYLVPHERLLPVESLRFFYIDDNWIDALLQGSFTIALECDSDAAVLATQRTEFDAAISKIVAAYRNHLRGLVGTTEPGLADGGYLGAPKTGFLLRSAAVSGWPGLEIDCFDANGQPLTWLRLERLSPEVMFGLVYGKIGKIVIKEPAEGIGFGVDEDGTVPLRYLAGNPDGRQAGQHVMSGTVEKKSNPVAMRDAEQGILDVATLASVLIKDLDLPDADGAKFRFQSAALALQLLRSPVQQTFPWTPKGGTYHG